MPVAPFTIAEIRAAAELVKESGIRDADFVAQQIIDTAIAERYRNVDQAAFRARMQELLRRQLARYRGFSIVRGNRPESY